MASLVCSVCSRQFHNAFSYNRHVNNKVCQKTGGKQIQCEICPAKFSRADNMKAHMASSHTNTMQQEYACGMCAFTCSSKSEIASHRNVHIERLIGLEEVDREMLRRAKRREMNQAIEDNANSEIIANAGFTSVKSAHKHKCEIMRFVFPEMVHFPDSAFILLRPRLLHLLEKKRVEHRMYNVTLTINIEMVQINEDVEIEKRIIVPFRSHLKRIRPLRKIDPLIEEAYLEICSTIEEFLHRGSGWSVINVLFADLEFSKCKPLSGGCGLHKAGYQRSQGLVFYNDGFRHNHDSDSNIITLDSDEDEDCFFLAIASHFLPQTQNFAALRSFITQNLKISIPTPVNLEDIATFETENNESLDLSVNVVYKDDDNKIYPVYVSKFPLSKNVVVLLLGAIGSSGNMHYARLDDPTSALAPRHYLSGKTRKVPAFFCFNCCNYQLREETHKTHIAWCHQKNAQKINYPAQFERMEYDGRKNSNFKLAYLLFFDFETLQVTPKRPCSCSDEILRNTEKMNGGYTDDEMMEMWINEDIEQSLHDLKNVEVDFPRKRTSSTTKKPPNPRKPKTVKVCPHKTKIVAEQHAFSYSYIIVSREGKVMEEGCYVGMDAAKHFLKTLLSLEKKYLDPFEMGGVPLDKSDPAVQAAYENARHCYICSGTLGNDRVRDHDHLTGKLLGIAHNICNLRRREVLRLVCFAHNFSGYDSHILLQAMGELEDEKLKQIFAVPLNTQKFKMMKFERLVLLDSAAFLPESLAQLTETLCASDHEFSLLKQSWSKSEDRSLLLRKGVYPYAFATSIDRLEKCTSLPPREAFFNDIGEVHISEDDYAHAQKVWTHFNCQNMLDYTKLYVRTDVYLLAEAVCDMRETVFKEFDLELAVYWSLPMLAKDIMLKMTDANIELLHDPEMVHMLQSNIRGGLSFINTRYFDTEERENHEEKKLRASTITYLDANNLYGKAMSCALPLRSYRWMTSEEIASFDPLTDVHGEEGQGYILEVTLRYPERLHRSHNSFPLAPETVEITDKDLSPYSTKCLHELTNKKTYKAKKLTATFRDRVEYVCHGMNLKFYLEQGLELVKIHRGITFHQSKFIKPYIDHFTKKRAQAKTKAASRIFKLLCNSLYGKVCDFIKFNYFVIDI